ncbi:MAG TPA: lipase, partial [Burkholderiales bacterium]|nr:lipase [Burkholderiales bacterium]
RAWSARLGGTSRAAALVTIGTPHHGSKLARGLRGQAWAPELRHGSRWLEALQAQEAGSARVPITSIYSWHDEFLVPQDSPCVTGARNIALERLGHLALLGSPQVHALLAAEIAAARAACPS